MNFDEVIAELEEAGSEQTRKTYRRHGAPDPMFGVSCAIQIKLAKPLRGNQQLAEELWASGNFDARWLACRIANPQQIKAGVLNSWLKCLDNGALSGALAELAAKTPRAAQFRANWIDLRNEWQCSAGWRLVAHAAVGNTLSQAEALPLLERIEREIHTAPNCVRGSMNGALIAIALVDKDCEEKAVAAARRIGVVEVDHGDTCCKTPDAVTHIAKCVAHRAKQASKRAEKRVAWC